MRVECAAEEARREGMRRERERERERERVTGRGSRSRNSPISSGNVALRESENRDPALTAKKKGAFLGEKTKCKKCECKNGQKRLPPPRVRHEGDRPPTPTAACSPRQAVS